MIELNFKKRLMGPFGEFDLEVNECIENNEFVSIFGKSGSGKSTILKIMAGLLPPDEGTIRVDGEIWNDKNFVLPPQKRNIGFVFQDHALFPNMSIYENICYGLKDKDFDFVKRILEFMELDNLKNIKPNALSGGQSQRVAIARALAHSTKMLLLDEPFSALDWEMSHKLQNELLSIYREFELSVFFVSHSISEVYRLSSKIMNLENGKSYLSDPKGMFSPKDNNLYFYAEVLDIVDEGLMSVVRVLINNNVFPIVSSREELDGICVGQCVKIAFRAFSPFIFKL